MNQDFQIRHESKHYRPCNQYKHHFHRSHHRSLLDGWSVKTTNCSIFIWQPKNVSIFSGPTLHHYFGYLHISRDQNTKLVTTIPLFCHTLYYYTYLNLFIYSFDRRSQSLFYFGNLKLTSQYIISFLPHIDFFA